MAWLDAPLLQYGKASILKVFEGVAIIIGAVLLLVLLDYVNPVQLWLVAWLDAALLQYVN